MDKRAIRRPATVTGLDRDNVVDVFGASIIHPDGGFETAVAEDLVDALNHRCPKGANEHTLRAAEERAALATGKLEVAEAKLAAAAERERLHLTDAEKLLAQLAAAREARAKAEALCMRLQAQVEALSGEADQAQQDLATRLRVLCDALGGEVDETRVGPENYLQRVRALRKVEADAEKAAAKAARRA